MKKITFILCLLFFAIQLNAQDTCLTATIIGPGTHNVAMVNGSEIPDPICAPNGAGATNGEWYSYTPTINGSATINTDLIVNAGGDTRVHVYTGACNALVCYAGSDDVDAPSMNYLTTLTFNILSGTTYYIAFDDLWSNTGFDFTLTELPLSCLPASAYIVEDLTDTTIDLSWSDNNTGTPTFEIEYGLQGFMQGAGTIDVGINGTSHTISGLTENTFYDLYIRANCGTGDGTSPWDGPLTFRTFRDCEPVAAYPYTEYFVDGTVLDCWALEDTDASSPTWTYNTDINDLDGDGTNDSFMVIFPQGPTELVKDDWMFSSKMGMVADNIYNIEVLYNAFDFNGTSANESFELIIVDEQSSTAIFQSVIGTYTNITQAGAIGNPAANLISEAYTASETFTPTTSGVYYIAIRATTVGTASLFMVFNLSVNGAVLSIDEFNQNSITHLYKANTKELILMSSSLPFHSVEIFNMFGQSVCYASLSKSQEMIKMDSFSDGMYLVKLNIQGYTKTLKVIKQ